MTCIQEENYVQFNVDLTVLETIPFTLNIVKHSCYSVINVMWINIIIRLNGSFASVWNVSDGKQRTSNPQSFK